MTQTWSLQKFFRLTKIGWNAFNLYTSDSLSFWPIFCIQSMVSLLTKCWPLYQPRYLPIVGRYVDLDLADISVDTSVNTSTNISRLWYRQRVSLYVDWHIGQVSVNMLTDTSVKCRLICWLIYWSRGAHNTHDPLSLQVFSMHLSMVSHRAQHKIVSWVVENLNWQVCFATWLGRLSILGW